MKYIAAYALVSLGGKTPAKADVEAVLKAAGVAIDASRIDALFAELDGKTFDEVAAEGKSKLVGAGAGAAPAAAAGAAPAAAAGGASAAAPAAAAGKAAEPEEEEADDDMGFGLFD